MRRSSPIPCLAAAIAGAAAMTVHVPADEACDPMYGNEYVSFVDFAPYPICLAAGDLDGDLDVDLVAGTVQGGAVYLLMNNGGGRFTIGNTLAVGSEQYGVAIGDLDGDLDLDVVATNESTGEVKVFYNNGSGGFPFSASFSVGGITADPREVVLHDLDDDNDLDMVVANSGADNVALLSNNGNGTFGSAVYLFLDASPSGIAVEDLDGELGPDLVVAVGEDEVQVLLANGLGGYETPVAYELVGRPRDVAIGDIDGDFDHDLIVGINWVAEVVVLSNNGDGTFAPPVYYDTGNGSGTVVVADFDADLDLDIAVPHGLSSTVEFANVTVLTNSGTGVFSVSGPFGCGGSHTALAPADFDGDADVDLAVSGNHGITTMRNDGSGAFPSAPTAYGTWLRPTGVALGDLDGDHDLDLAAGENWVEILLNNGDATFPVTGLFETNDADYVALGDLDADGDLDVATSGHNGGASVLLNNGDASFADAVLYDGGVAPCALIIVDLDADDDADIVIPNVGHWDYDCQCYLDAGLRILRNDGSGTFNESVLYPATAAPDSVAAADLDGDLDIDLVTASEGKWDVGCSCFLKDPEVTAYLNNGDGTLGPPTSFDGGLSPRSIQTSDLDGDQDVDVVVANANHGVSVLLNDGGGTLGPAVFYESLTLSSWQVVLTDVDSDADPDLIVTSIYGDGAVLLNNGDGTLATAQPFVVDLYAADVLCTAVGDLDGDLLPDLVLGDGNVDRMWILLNSCTPNCLAPAVAVPGEVATIQAAIDLVCNGGEVVIEPGTWTGPIDLQGKAITLRSTNPDDPAIVAATVLQGDGSGSVLTCSSGEGPDTVIAGFTITGGTGTLYEVWDGNFESFGGGMVIDGSHPTVQRCVFTQNTAAMGGGMHVRQGGVTLTDCEFVANTAEGLVVVSGSGGGLNLWQSVGVITRCRFAGNAAVSGGGMQVYDSEPVFVIDTDFVGNTTEDGTGGGMYVDGFCDVRLWGCRFLGNSAAGGYGGGLANEIGSQQLVNCLFAGNDAALGGGIVNFAETAPVLTNCTIAMNTAIDGGGLFNQGDGMPVTPTLVNCVVWSNTAQTHDDVGGDNDTTFAYCDIRGSGGSGDWNTSFGIDGGGNIDADPLFVDPDGPDDAPGTTDDDLRLGTGSPSIDAGNSGTSGLAATTTDLDGNPRFVDDPSTPDTGAGEPPIVDMGPYEFQVPCPADTDGNGDVDVVDLLAVILGWGTDGEGNNSDVDGSGVVDVLDLLEVILGWGECP